MFLVNFVSGTHGHAGHVGHNVFFKTFFLGHRVTLVTWVTLWFFEKKIVSRSQGHVDHVIFFVGKFCFWVTGSRGYTKLGHVCDPEDYSTQRHKIGSHM